MHHLLIGLGNPGSSYSGNRHNVGFMALDRVTSDWRFSAPKKAFGGIVCEGMIGARKCYAFKPMGYMNTSGVAAGELARFYKIPPEAITVIHDDLDLAFGKLRTKTGGGNGGHNGLKSLDAHLGADYARLRFGIGHPGDKDLVSDYVLSDFSKEEMLRLPMLLAEISRHAELLVAGDGAGFLNNVALAMKMPS